MTRIGQEMLKLRNYVPPVKENIDKLDIDTLEGLRSDLIIQKTKTKLGINLNQTLKQLIQQVKIKYYN